MTDELINSVKLGPEIAQLLTQVTFREKSN